MVEPGQLDEFVRAGEPRGDLGRAGGIDDPVGVAPVPLYEGAQLGLAKGLLPLVVGYFFFPPRAP